MLHYFNINVSFITNVPTMKIAILDITSYYLIDSDLAKVFGEVYDARTKWRAIGLKLDVPIGELNAIEAIGSDLDVKCMTMLEKWLQSGKNVTWKDLADAMGAKTVGRVDIKQRLLGEYC